VGHGHGDFSRSTAPEKSGSHQRPASNQDAGRENAKVKLNGASYRSIALAPKSFRLYNSSRSNRAKLPRDPHANLVSQVIELRQPVRMRRRFAKVAIVGRAAGIVSHVTHVAPRPSRIASSPRSRCRFVAFVPTPELPLPVKFSFTDSLSGYIRAPREK
jgi:hypothetical protein